MRQERIVFMGTPEISKVYLQSLIDHQYNIIATYTQPPRKQGRGMQIQKSPVHALSLEHNIPVYHPKNFASLESIDELKKLIENHSVYTGSDVAKRILKNWDKELKAFKKIMPTDYKRVLLERDRKEKKAG